jgi:hypothetical protein
MMTEAHKYYGGAKVGDDTFADIVAIDDEIYDLLKMNGSDQMTDVEIINKQTAQLTDRLDRATARVEALVIERQSLGYDLHINESKQAKARLSELAQELSHLHEEKDTLAGAIAELKKRAADAMRVTERADASERCKRARELLIEIEACGPLLDRVIEHPEGGMYSPNDPPLQSKVAALAGDLLTELRALRLTDATFPRYRWDLSTKPDLTKALRDTVRAGWPALSGKIMPNTSASVPFGERRYISIDFVKLLAVWCAAVRADLTRYERANTEQSNAAA